MEELKDDYADDDSEEIEDDGIEAMHVLDAAAFVGGLFIGIPIIF